MLRWRASGPHSSRSWSTTVITEAGRRQLERSRNISSSSITASAARPGWGSCHPRRMSRNSMLDYQQHERFGVHYLRPTSYVRGAVHVNNVESIWSNTKRGIDGVNHAVSPQHLQGYLDSYVFRYNHRNDETPMYATLTRQVSKVRQGKFGKYNPLA